MAIPDFTPAKVFKDQFTVAFPPAEVFDMLGDVAQEIRQMGTRLHRGGDGACIDGEPDHGHATASRIARPSTAT